MLCLFNKSTIRRLSTRFFCELSSGFFSMPFGFGKLFGFRTAATRSHSRSHFCCCCAAPFYPTCVRARFFYWILFYCSTFSTFNSEHNFVLIRLLLKVFRSNCGTSFYPLFIQFSRILTGSYFQCTANLTDNSIRWLSSVVVNHEKLFSRRLNNHK